MHDREYNVVVPVDKQFWWQTANSVRIPLGILLAIGWTLRLRRIHADIKSTPERSPKTRRIQLIVLAALWSFIVVIAIIVLLTKAYQPA